MISKLIQKKGHQLNLVDQNLNPELDLYIFLKGTRRTSI